jgi:hypothetical protein
VVCRGVCDGGALEHRAPLPAPLRHGSRLGAGGQAAGAGLHRYRVRGHDHLRGQCGRTERGLRYRYPGDDGLSRHRRGAHRLARGI